MPSGGEWDQESPLLRLTAEQEDVRRAQAVVRGDRQRDGRVDASEFLDADAVVDGRQSGAAVYLGNLHTEQAELGEAGHQFSREVLRLVPLTDVGPHLGFGELAHTTAQEFLFVGRPEVHASHQRITARRKRGWPGRRVNRR